MGTSSMLAGSTGIETPPGITAFTLRPSGGPPACSKTISSSGVPSGSSKRPGRTTCPETPNIVVPGLFSVPKPRNQSAPLPTMCGTWEKVSTLFTVVGMPKAPYSAGKGGFLRGWPFLPSSDSSRPVSSPQM